MLSCCAPHPCRPLPLRACRWCRTTHHNQPYKAAPETEKEETNSQGFTDTRPQDPPAAHRLLCDRRVAVEFPAAKSCGKAGSTRSSPSKFQSMVSEYTQHTVRQSHGMESRFFHPLLAPGLFGKYPARTLIYRQRKNTWVANLVSLWNFMQQSTIY